jgi:hypothetical protein
MGIDTFRTDSEVKQGSRLSTRLTCESGEVKVADEETSINVVIPELSPDDELPDDRVDIKVTRKISYWKYEAEIADDVSPQETEGPQEDAYCRINTMKDGFGDSDLMRDILNKR